MPVERTPPATLPKTRGTRTSLELKPHKDDRMAIPKIKERRCLSPQHEAVWRQRRSRALWLVG